MLDISINKAAYFSLASTLAFSSLSGLMLSRDCLNINTQQINTGQESTRTCMISPCSRANMQMAIASGFITSGIYMYRVFL